MLRSLHRVVRCFEVLVRTSEWRMWSFGVGGGALMNRLFLIVLGSSVAAPALAWDATGLRMDVPQDGHTVSTSPMSVAGSNGGTTGLEVGGAVRIGEWNVGLSLPFASYRGFDGGRGDVGNMTLSGRRSFASGSMRHYVGLDLSAGLGAAYTWTHEAPTIWPSSGFSAVYGAVGGDDALAWGVEARLGMYFTEGYPPFPERYTRTQLVGMLDQTLADNVGLVAELSLAHWDVSPMDAAAMLRVDPLDGFRVRTGLVLPVGTWASVGPAESVHGLREVSWTLDVQLLQ